MKNMKRRMSSETKAPSLGFNSRNIAILLLATNLNKAKVVKIHKINLSFGGSINFISLEVCTITKRLSIGN